MSENKIPSEVKQAILARDQLRMSDPDGVVLLAYQLNRLEHLWLRGHALEVNFSDAMKVLAAARDRTGTSPYPDLPSMVEAYGCLMYSMGVADVALGYDLVAVRKKRVVLAIAETVGDQLIWEIWGAVKDKYWSPPSLVFKLPRTPPWGENIADSPSEMVYRRWWFAGQVADSLRAFAEWARREAQDPEGSVRLVGYLDRLMGEWVRNRTRATIYLEPVRRVLIASRIRELELPRPDMVSLLRAYGALMRAKGVVDTTIRSWAWRERAKKFMLNAIIDALEREIVKEIWREATRAWRHPSIYYW